MLFCRLFFSELMFSNKYHKIRIPSECQAICNQNVGPDLDKNCLQWCIGRRDQQAKS